MKPSVVDLFCGAGGLSYGLDQAGFRTLLGIDHDYSAIQTFTENIQGAVGLVQDLSAPDINAAIGAAKIKGGIDVLAGGPPCQGMSLSGPRDPKDPRNKLFLAYLDFIDALKPRAIILENVPGLVGLYEGKIKDQILKSFDRLGYQTVYKVLTASSYGVPQSRKRVIFVATRKDLAIHFAFPEVTHANENVGKKLITCAEAISDLPSLKNGKWSEEMKYETSPRSDYQEQMRVTSDCVRNHIGTFHNDEVVKTISLIPDGGNYKDLPRGYVSTRNFNVAWTRFNSAKPAPTIDTGHRHHFHYKWNRVPTVREAARLQSFPDHFIFTGTKTSQARQVGNAVPPILAEAIGKELLKCL